MKTKVLSAKTRLSNFESRSIRKALKLISSFVLGLVCAFTLFNDASDERQQDIILVESESNSSGAGR
jgi:hypothetical protein